MFPIKNQNNEFVILQSFIMTIFTFLQCFQKNSFAGDVVRNKCLHEASSNAGFCMHYIEYVNYCSLIMVVFPIGSMRKHLLHVRMRV